jgi:protein-disulfide isomerase
MLKKNGIEKKDLLVPISILIGAILVSGSIFINKLPWSGEAVIDEAGNNDAGTVVTQLNDRKDAPKEGNGKVKIVEFSDFQCPFCQSFFKEAYSQIKSQYVDTGKAEFVFRHYPLPFHANAQKAAEAAECANKQGRFWEYHNILFEKSKSDGTGLYPADLKKYAKDLGLNTDKFNSCLDNGEAAEAVRKDNEDAQKAGVDGTPTIFINGKKIVGAKPFADFQAEIDAALK